MKNNWLNDFKDTYQASESFLNELNIQLSQEFYEKVGFKLPVNRIILICFIYKLEYDNTNNIYKTNVDIFDKKENLGITVSLGWRMESGKNVKPNEVITQGNINFFWIELPKEELLILFKKKQPKPYIDSTNLNFEIYWDTPIFPDISLVMLIDKPNLEFLGLLENTIINANIDLIQTMDKDLYGTIHFISKLQKQSESIYTISINMGTADIPSLQYILNKISQFNQNYFIKKISIS